VDTNAGAVGGRAGADALCQWASRPPQIPTNSNIHALLSVDANDEIRDFPNKYGARADAPIVGPTGLKIADNWSDLLDGSLDLSLANAFVVTNSPLFYYTGSNQDGSLSDYNCSGWTNGSTPAGATLGSKSQTNNFWLSATRGSCGSAGVK